MLRTGVPNPHANAALPCEWPLFGESALQFKPRTIVSLDLNGARGARMPVSPLLRTEAGIPWGKKTVIRRSGGGITCALVEPSFDRRKGSATAEPAAPRSTLRRMKRSREIIRSLPLVVGCHGAERWARRHDGHGGRVGSARVFEALCQGVDRSFVYAGQGSS